MSKKSQKRTQLSINDTGINLDDVFKVSKPQAPKPEKKKQIEFAEETKTYDGPDPSKPLDDQESDEEEEDELDYGEIEEPETRTPLLIKIRGYWTSPRFSKYLKQCGYKLHPRNLKKYSSQQLEKILTDVKLAVANKTSTGMIDQGAISMLFMAEEICSRYVMDVRGTTQALGSSDAFLDMIAELALEHQSVLGGSVHYRLADTVLSTAVMTNQTKKMLEDLKKSPEGLELLKKMQEQNTKLSAKSNKAEMPEVKRPKTDDEKLTESIKRFREEPVDENLEITPEDMKVHLEMMKKQNPKPILKSKVNVLDKYSDILGGSSKSDIIDL